MDTGLPWRLRCRECIAANEAWFLLQLMTWASKRDYCQNEVMEARCSRGEVVVVQNATYGRMRLSKCIKKNYGYIGCEADVTGPAHSMCSGRQNCNIRVPNTMFDEASISCPEDFKKYLEASYSCEKVFLPSGFNCQSQRVVKLTDQNGVLASAVTMETECGSPKAPYIIEARRGQTISISMLDFSYYERAKLSPAETKPTCEALAVIKESSDQHSKTICGSNTRQRDVYNSSSNRVQITIMDRINPKYFLLKYQIHGCPSSPQLANSWAQRSGDSVVIHCNQSSISYSLSCVNGSWVGRMGNCSAEVSTGGLLYDVGLAMNYELAVVLIVAIALVIACCILCVGIVWMKSKRSSTPPMHSGTQRPPEVYYDHQQYGGERSLDGYSRKDAELMWNYDPTRGENVYASIQETPTLHRGDLKGHSCDPAPCGIPALREDAHPYDHTVVPCMQPYNHNAPEPVMTDTFQMDPNSALRQYFVLDSSMPRPMQRIDVAPEQL
ncbi:hypothetical protein CAPTEDRAFT_199346 [Capitella teleta]|uniref:SUEL-type lectin domain-containing protein n=1 Tax=Capitella teleta TaxID=283909 RepID=R7TUP3_CAPTE|nr:hypothetical protein CAPTEDRAFT_199346 [Capitella teleta]|eukprot:ELT97287.1 hypothetical protein CAPTEDRAFT_199346 [Capitella teleta]